MNARIQTIWNKVQDYIRSKVVAHPEPNLIWGGHEAEIMEETLVELNNALAQINGPAAPANVSWKMSPVVEIVGNALDVTDGIANLNGVLVTVPADSITVTLPEPGFNRPCSLIADYLADPPFYMVLEGATVGENDSYAFPPLPANRLWVSNFMVTNAGIIPAPTGAVKEITLNGGAPQVPNASGSLNLTDVYTLESPTTTAVGLMPSGTDTSGWTWQEIWQCISTGEMPTATVTATPLSDKQIGLNW